MSYIIHSFCSFFIVVEIKSSVLWNMFCKHIVGIHTRDVHVWVQSIFLLVCLPRTNFWNYRFWIWMHCFRISNHHCQAWNATVFLSVRVSHVNFCPVNRSSHETRRTVIKKGNALSDRKPAISIGNALNWLVFNKVSVYSIWIKVIVLRQIKLPVLVDFSLQNRLSVAVTFGLTERQFTEVPRRGVVGSSFWIIVSKHVHRDTCKL